MIFHDTKHTEWDVWDLKLLKAHHFMEMYVRDGIPVWWDDNDRVSWEAKRRVSRAKAAVDRAEQQDTGKNKKPVPGRYYVPESHTIDGGEMPTFQEWVEQQAEKNNLKTR